MITIRQYCHERGITLRQLSIKNGMHPNWAANLQYKGAKVCDGVIYSAAGRKIKIVAEAIS